MGMLLWKIKERVRHFVPPPFVNAYHFSLALFGAALYGFPSSKMIVIAVTGTKGKSSTVELVNAIFEGAGYTTALLNSIRFKIAGVSEPNLLRMTTPGRFFIQDFLARAARARCAVAIIELTSEGARQYRHRGLSLDALIFTNLAPEHIESHGSLEAYANAKFEIGKQLARSHKRPRVMVANADDMQSNRYLTLPVESALPFSLSSYAPFGADKDGGFFTFDGTRIAIKLPGEFSLMNAVGAATLASAFNIHTPVIAKALGALERIPGRAERIEAGQPFDVVVDYAHTPDSLSALYSAYGNVRKICVLGSTGGGRDMWKRPIMGSIAESYCSTVILTNEDPYDEDPRSIVDDMARGMKQKPLIIMERRNAIAHAVALAETLREAQDNQKSVAVLITGKGTDPCICGPRGSKVPWSDAQVAREEIDKLLTRETL
ncbi:MAG TPA: UDP-N-acetylmuramyl-tripeptide synthetase [Candidatus Paceibacterota bacterium]|nr:UDP-N-acetylmuramyl-tripeptide synthetase [Candidatus Paceibacterota bacterium]